MKNKGHVLVIRESLAQSLLSDLGTFLMVFSLIGIGVVLESEAMQWFGFLMAAVGCLSIPMKLRGEFRKTPQEAADWLLREFEVRASDESP